MSVGPLMRGKREKEKESFFLFKSWRSAFSSQKEKERKKEIPISILPALLSPPPKYRPKTGFNCEFSSLFCLVSFPLPSYSMCIAFVTHTHTQVSRRGISRIFFKKIIKNVQKLI